ncbi:MAG: sigma-70 family RNA polymerase sigma factor, partial [Eubacterium sp.]
MENKNTMKDKSLQWLVIHAQKGTPDAFEELYHRTCQKQYYYARMLLHDAFLAEDIVQEVFIKLYKRIGYIKEPDAFNGYLSRMTYNECMHYRRKKYLDTETCVEQDYLNSFEDKITLLSPESSLLSVEKSKLLAEGLKTLSEEERFSLMMYAYENMNIDTIGKAMKLSRSTVKRRIASAKEKMVRYLS